MYYVTKDYITKEFATEVDAYNYIVSDLERHHLSYKKVCDKTDNDIQVIVFNTTRFIWKCTSFTKLWI